MALFFLVGKIITFYSLVLLTIKAKRIIFKIRWKYNNTICPHCGLKTSKRQDKKLHKQNRLILHMIWIKVILIV